MRNFLAGVISLRDAFVQLLAARGVFARKGQRLAEPAVIGDDVRLTQFLFEAGPLQIGGSSNS
jgi:hypothetical protein